MSASRSLVIPISLLAFLAAAGPIRAQTVASLSCTPTVIEGGSGGSATCDVTLSARAPTGGTVVTLASSLVELAASLPSVTVPRNKSRATFTVATNAHYRQFSQMSFTPAISATANGTTQTVTLLVTAQPLPPPFNSGSQGGANTQWEGLMCGGIAPIGGHQGILFSCSRADGTGFGSCTFHQECTLGCRRVPPNGQVYNDFCAVDGPNPVAVSRNYVASGDRIPATIVGEAPATNQTETQQGVPSVLDPNFNSIVFPFGGVPFPNGATSVPFEVATSFVPSIQFVDVNGFWFDQSVPPFLITSGRAGAVTMVMLPPDPPPAVAIPTLGDFQITGLNPVTGGQQTIGQVDLSGLSRVGGPTITITSSHPDIVPPVTVDAPASEQFFGFQVDIATKAPPADTDVEITATDGFYTFRDTLQVLAPPPPPVLKSLSLNPDAVVGGNSSIGTVTLSAPQNRRTVVQIRIGANDPATLPSTNDPPCEPDIQCHNVTVPAGATSATFTISTQPVSFTFNLNVFAFFPDDPAERASALLIISPDAIPRMSSLSLDPEFVVGGNPSTGTVRLTAVAPAGGATVALSSDNTKVATVPRSVTVPEGQTRATFRVSTKRVDQFTSVFIIGRINETERGATLTVGPSASANTAPRSPQ
jgi:hypothetical protein